MRLLAIAALVAGIGFIGLGVHVALFGAERELTGPERIEGTVLPGRTTPSPAGEPFLFGRVRIRSAARDGKSMMHVDRTFGEATVRVDTGAGARALRLPSPDDWRVTSAHEERATFEDLADVPLLEGSDVERMGRAIPPPYEVSVRAVRAGDHLLARASDGAATRVSVGDPAELARDGAAQDSARWPVVLLLFVIGAASCVAGVVAHRSARKSA